MVWLVDILLMRLMDGLGVRINWGIWSCRGESSHKIWHICCR